MSFYDWSTTASNNGAIDAAINWAEFQDPSTVNDSARAMMARVAEWRKDVAPTRSSTGSGNAYAVTSEAGGSTAYRDGEIVTFIADRANTAGCTLNVNARGAKAFRPAIGVDFKAGEIQANQAIIAFYRSATEEFIGIGSGYHVNAMTTGLLSQSIAARLIKIGTPVLSLAPSAPAGYIRLTEATQTCNKSDWPELDAWLSSISYPWGSTSTTFNLPPAAGYVLRFAATSSSIDTAGARSAGSTQTDAVAAHTHTFSATTSTDGAHTHTYTAVTSQINTGSSGSSHSAVQTGTLNTGSAGSHFHTLSGTTGSTGGTETRPRNVAMHVDIFASSQQSAGTLAMFGFPYAWDVGTSAANPGTARVRGNNATLASITALYINDTDAWGVDIGSVLGAITNGSVIRLSKVGAQANTLVMTVAGSITDSGTYRAIPVTVTAVNGSFSSNDSLAFELAGGAGATGATGPQGPQGAASTITIGTVTTGAAGSSASVTNVGTSSAAILDFAIPQGAKGDKGDTGDTGATGSTGPTGATGAAGADGIDSGIRWRFDISTTTNADPGTGDLRLNNAALASVTEIAISYSANETGNPSVESFVKAWDDSTTTGNRGQLIIKKVGAAENYAVYAITSAITDGTTYGRFTLSHVSSAGTISNTDAVSVQFSRTGDKGVDGLGAGDVVGPASATDGSLARFDGATGKLLKNGAVIGTDVQAYDATLASLAGLGTASDKIAYTTGVDTWAETALTSTARSLLDDTSAGAMRTTLGVVPGTDVQAYDATLAALATYNTNGILTQTAADTFAGRTITGTASEITVTNGDGVGGNPTLALHSGVYRASGTDVALADGGTGASLTDPNADRMLFWDDSAGAMTWLAVGSGLSITNTTVAVTGALVCDGRLTATSGTAVTTANVTGATSIYYTPYKGNRIALYDGSSGWVYRTFTEITIALGTLSSGVNYDVFLYDNSGTVAVDSLVAWTNATTRATALVLQDGVYVKSGATTRRYVGTFRTTSTTTTEDSLSNRFVWNAYNRVARPMVVFETTDTWTWSTNAWQQANNSTANQLAFVRGLDEDDVIANAASNVVNSTSTTRYVRIAIGLDSTSAPSSGSNTSPGAATDTFTPVLSVSYFGLPGLGYHYLTWLEKGAGVDTQTWRGDAGQTDLNLGMNGSVMA